MSFLNTNTLHNVLNITVAVLGVLVAVAIAFGCIQTAAGTLDCSHSSLNPTWLGILTALAGGLKLLVNIGRDGVSGLMKPQPPVDHS